MRKRANGSMESGALQHLCWARCSRNAIVTDLGWGHFALLRMKGGPRSEDSIRRRRFQAHCRGLHHPLGTYSVALGADSLLASISFKDFRADPFDFDAIPRPTGDLEREKKGEEDDPCRPAVPVPAGWLTGASN